MRVCVVTEHRFYQSVDGAVWTDGPFAQRFWDRYLEVFDEVRVVARLRSVETPDSNWLRSDGDRVSFAPVTHYLGPFEFALKRSAVRHSVCRSVQPKDAVIVRVPSTLAMLLVPKLRKIAHPYAVEAVGDPYDVFAPGAIRHPLRPYLRWRLTREMQQHCRHAIAAAYVTTESLQRRYPPGVETREFEFSDVQLSGRYVTSPRQQEMKSSWTLITIGSLGHLYKAQDIQIDAVARLRSEGLNVQLRIIGDGCYRQELTQRARNHGIGQHVVFTGQLTEVSSICDELDHADLFLLPSRQEGLPRALIEAMARGLPCIGSHVGGIPELLPIEDRVAPNNVETLTNKIREVLTDNRRMQQMSARNLQRSCDFAEEKLRVKRKIFYEYVRHKTLDCSRDAGVTDFVSCDTGRSAS